MSKVKTEDIKKIREKTGASLAMIQKALLEAGGDTSQALEVLKSLGHKAVLKKESRTTGAGRIEAYIHSGSRVGVLVEIRSETDFVSRGEEFGEFAHNIAMHIAAMAPETVDELLKQPYVRDEGQTIEDVLMGTSAKFGERLEIKRFVRFEL